MRKWGRDENLYVLIKEGREKRGEGRGKGEHIILGGGELCEWGEVKGEEKVRVRGESKGIE